MDLMEYLRAYSNGFNKYQHHKHRTLVKRLLENPNLIDINGVLEAYSEVGLVMGGRKIGNVDLIYLTPNDMYLIKVKTQDKNSGTRVNPEKQLERAYVYFLRNYNVAARMIKVVQRGKRIKHTEIERPLEDTLKMSGFSIQSMTGGIHFV